jgi:AraC-like DNA-binding protein
MAARLLRVERQTNLDVIAGRCGFQSQASFSKAFKKLYGVTPASGGVGKRLVADDRGGRCRQRRKQKIVVRFSIVTPGHPPRPED